MADPYKDQLAESGAKTYSGYDMIVTAINKIGSTMDSIGNMVGVIIENWKLAAIGVVALVVLLKD